MLLTLRLLVGAMMGALVFFGVAVMLVLGPEGGLDDPPPWILTGLLLLGGVLHVVIELYGYRVSTAQQALPTTAQVFQAMTIIRAALAESVAIAALGLAFVVEQGGVLIYLLGAVLGLALLGWHAFPWKRPIRRTADALRVADVSNDLEAELGLPPRRAGIEEL